MGLRAEEGERTIEIVMKTLCYALIGLLFLSIAACEKKPKTLGEKVGEKVDDALDRRPAEKVRDAAEDVKDAARDAKNDVKDAVKDAK